MVNVKPSPVNPSPVNPALGDPPSGPPSAPTGAAPVNSVGPAPVNAPLVNSTGVGVGNSSGSAGMGSLAASFARVRLAFAESDIGATDFSARICRMINDDIARGQAGGKEAWIDIYEARRLNILLLGPDDLSQAIVMALQELVDDRVAAGQVLQKAFDDLKVVVAGVPQPPTTQPRLLRLLLLDIIEAIQWHEQKRHLIRRKTREAANRLVRCWGVTFVLFIAPYVVAVVSFSQDRTLALEAWSAMVPWTVLAAGLMGALFSRLIYLQSNWTSLSLDQVEDARLWCSILLRGSVGMCAAVIVFLFVRSGIIKSSILPDFTEVSLHKITGSLTDVKGEADLNLTFLAPSLAFSLLIIWCFLAGFSERFVPDILAATEKKLSVVATK